MFDVFETPVTMTPQQDISNTFDSSKISKTYFKFTSWGILNVYFGGHNVYFWGRGGLGLCGSRGPVGVIENI